MTTAAAARAARTTAADPFAEIRMTTLHATRGANYWSRRPVTRMDLVVGAFDDISSAEVGGVTEALSEAMPGLAEHHCSIGEPGGFLLRLRRGTYVPHIVEHVALELQAMMGHDVGYGRTRGGDVPGEYTLVFEHRHEAVGLRAASLALEAVQRAFAGTLHDVEHAVAELRAIAESSDVPPLQQEVLCGITGGAHRAELQRALSRRGSWAAELAVNVSPAYLLQAGLPYHRSEIGVVLDTTITDVPPRYREQERAERLLGVIADGVRRGGTVVVPARAWDIQDYARERGRRVAVFSDDGPISRRDAKVACMTAWLENDVLHCERTDGSREGTPLMADEPAVVQLAATLATAALRDARSEARTR